MSFLGFGGGGNQVNVRITGDASQLNKELKGAKGQAESFERDTGRAVRRTATGIAAALGVGAAVAVAGFAKSSVKSFSDLNESVNAVEVTFGSAADGILELGKKAAETRGISNAAFNSMAVQFSAFAETVAGQSGRGVADVIDELTLRGTDFASVMNLEVGDALQKFQSGLAGEIEPLRKFGIDMSAAAVKAKALELGIGTTTGELTEQEKVLVRYQLLMEQTNKTAGDFAATSEDLANKQRTANAEFEDANAALGEDLAPIMVDLLETATNLIPVLEKLAVPFRGLAIAAATDDLERFDRQAGHTKGTAENLAGAISKLSTEQSRAGDETGGLRHEIEELIKISGADDAELRRLRDGLDELVKNGFLTKQAAELLSEAIGVELHDSLVKAQGSTEGAGLALQDGMTPAMTDAAKASRALAGDTEELAEAEDDQREATERAKKALQEKQEALRNIHNPLFRAVSLTDALAEAEKAVEAASKKGVGSDEYRDAVIDRAEVLSDLTDTLLELIDKGIDPTGAAARQMLSELGIPDEVIDGIFADVDAIVDKIESAKPRMTIDMFLPAKTFPTGGGGSTTIGPFHDGGVVPGLPGQNQLAQVAGGETILPTHDPHKMAGMNGGNVTIVNIGTQLGAERKLREIQEEARRQ